MKTKIKVFFLYKKKLLFNLNSEFVHKFSFNITWSRSLEVH